MVNPFSSPAGHQAPATGSSGARRRPGPSAGPAVSWYFGEPGVAYVGRDPVWAEFFHSADSIRDDREALVREAIQNSLDSRVRDTHPVLVRFTLSGDKGALDPAAAARYFGGLVDHVEASGVDSAPIKQKCRFLVVEDFQTHGLRGDPATQQDSGGVRNDFAYFFWREGKSGKGGKDGGRWGIGKYVFPMASQAYTYFGYTIRDSDGDDSPDGLLMGAATLKNHEVSGTAFLPDGRWGRRSESSFLPHTDASRISKFRDDWSVSRRPGEPGLSVVVPYVDDEWTSGHILKAVLEEYFVAILEKQLVVEIKDLDTGSTNRIDAGTVKSAVSGLADVSLRHRVLADIELVRTARAGTEHDLSTDLSGRHWSKVKYDEEALEKAREAFERDSWVSVRVAMPVELKATGTGGLTGHMQVLMRREEDFAGRPLFIRNGIMVKDAVRKKTYGVRVIVLVNEPNLAKMLGDAEGPAHVSWSESTNSFRGRYKYGGDWLRVVRQTPGKMIELIESSGKERDFSLAKDYFSVPVSSPKGRPAGQPRKPPGPGHKGPDVMRKELLSSGFKLSLASGATPRQIRVWVGYDRRKGNPFAKWKPQDFTLDGSGPGPGIRVSRRGCKVRKSGNELVITGISPGRFSLTLTGFDTRRDVAVRWEVS